VRLAPEESWTNSRDQARDDDAGVQSIRTQSHGRPLTLLISSRPIHFLRKIVDRPASAF
jgi:hypothetical protein